MATITFECVDERDNDYVGKKGEVKETIVTLIDRSPGPRIRHTVEYVLTEEEERRYKGKLTDKRIVLGVQGNREWMGAIRYEGVLLEVDGKSVNGKAGAANTGS